MRAKTTSWIVSVGGHLAVAAFLLFGLPQKPIQAEEKFQGVEVLLLAAASPPEPVVVTVPPPPPPPPPEPDPIVSKSAEPDLEPAPPSKPKPVVRKPEPPRPAPPKQDIKPVVESPPQPVLQPPPQQVAVAPVAPVAMAPRAAINPDVKNSYLALIAAILEKNKDYPRRAQLKNLQGTTFMEFTIDRQGRVLRYHIQRSSGHGILDEATKHMIERVDRFPPIPPELDEATLDVVMPMQYVMKR